MNPYINRRDGAVSVAAAAPPPFEDSDERRREREERWLLGDVLLGGRCRLCCRASVAGPSGLWPHGGAPKCSPRVSVTVGLTDQLQLLPSSPLVSLLLLLPLPPPPGSSPSCLVCLFQCDGGTRPLPVCLQGHFFFFQLPTFFTFHFQQNVSVKIFSFSCLTEDQEISTDGNVNIRPDDLQPRPHLAG